jgi:3-oxoadipate enol-lactonase
VGLHAEVAGEGPAVVLLHAGICDSRMWDAQWETFTRSHRVLRFDLRGYGRSPLEAGSYSHARDVLDLLAEHGMDRAALVGVSGGGRIALELAIERPELVTALVLVGSGLPGHQWSDALHAVWREEEAAFDAGDLDAAVEVSLRTWVDGPRRRPDEVEQPVRESVGVMQRRAYELERALDGQAEEEPLVPDLAERLSEIRAPTLVLVGEEDVADIHAIAQRLAAEIPGARFETIAGAGHVPNMERPEEFDRLVLGFLAEAA